MKKNETIRIADLDINEVQKMILALTFKPRTAYMIAAKTKKSYSSVNQNLGILIAHKLVIRIKKMSGGVIYKANDQVKP